MAVLSHADQKAIIIDCVGPVLSDDERALYRDHNPHGFILFQRHCENPDQLKKLVNDLRECVGREDAPILIDQEGGSVARLREPNFREFPSALKYREMARDDLAAAEQAVYENARAMARQLKEFGINVNCTPVMDIPVAGSHEFLAAKRVYGDNPETVTALARQVCKGHLDEGVTPIFKHIPGHGRATVDSHFDLPRISASHDELRESDFLPFMELSKETWAKGVWAMTAHVIYEDIDPDNAGTLSYKVIHDVIRGEVGFPGIIIADDVSMKALKGDMPELAKRTIEAGCDLTLLCNQNFDINKGVLENTPLLNKKINLV